MLDPAHKAPSARRERKARNMRAYRQRQQACRASAPVEYDGRTVDMLIRLHWLPDDQADNRAAIGQAIARMLAASSA